MVRHRLDADTIWCVLYIHVVFSTLILATCLCSLSVEIVQHLPLSSQRSMETQEIFAVTYPCSLFVEIVQHPPSSSQSSDTKILVTCLCSLFVEIVQRPPLSSQSSEPLSAVCPLAGSILCSPVICCNTEKQW